MMGEEMTARMINILMKKLMTSDTPNDRYPDVVMGGESDSTNDRSHDAVMADQSDSTND